jgi:hypothetical protein
MKDHKIADFLLEHPDETIDLLTNGLRSLIKNIITQTTFGDPPSKLNPSTTAR